MIVCHCFCVSDREIRSCARAGARDLSEVGRACGAGTGCGGCRPEISSILEASDGEHASSARISRMLPQLSEAG
jgi:bacterioferritin-associated ferredoxin